MTDISTCANHIDCSSRISPKSQDKSVLATFMGNMIAKLQNYLELRRQRKIDRNAMLTLLSLDEASLKDIGISRDDVIWASKLAMHKNASLELEKIRAQNIATARLKASQTKR